MGSPPRKETLYYRKVGVKMPTRVKISGLDNSDEATSFGVVMADMTAANFDAQVAALSAVQVAAQGVTLIAFDGKVYNAVDVPPEEVVPASKAAQREIKWRCKVADGTDPLGSFTFEIGGADTSLLGSDGKYMDLSAGAGLALKTAIEANCVSRLGNAVTFVSAKLVGRNI